MNIGFTESYQKGDVAFLFKAPLYVRMLYAPLYVRMLYDAMYWVTTYQWLDDIYSGHQRRSPGVYI